ncbi:MAG: hypothetical protein ACYTGW_02095 [Planctomycetota bacterium]|jgi:hypothetical protein
MTTFTVPSWTLKGALLQGELRRARVRLGFKDTGYQSLAPVAV